ncbi:phage head closure protein [Aliamphritea ceti]|uniref:phage head closure protein n=1 Tax=Aliamphritea ceti TaxID=1524258 RepID=UPI0021C37A19|nr:phage head closure protein [Aliamphritea ceti]
MQQFPHRVTLQVKTTTKNDFSEEEVTWVDTALKKIKADVKNLSGRETKDSDQTQNFIVVSVRIRNRPGVSDDMRLKHGDRKLRIMAVLPDPTNRYLDLKCEEWTDG